MTPAQLQALLKAGQAGSTLAGAYNSNLASASPYLGTAASGLGIAQGIGQGGVAGYGGAGASATQLAGKLAGNSNLAGAGADLGNALGIYQGIKQGGVAGDAGAAINAAQLGSRLGMFGDASGALGNAAGWAAIPLSLYNEVNSWESGKTGQDALGGASTGAAIGTAVLPGIGTAVGALLGGAAGALSSAFGNGAVDPENKSFEAYTKAYNSADPSQRAAVAASDTDPYLALAGYMDLRPNQLKGDNPIYTTYGRKGEQQFTNDLATHINDAVKSGAIKPTDSADTIYQKAVAPWISSMGNWQDSNKDAMTGLLQQMTNQYVSGQASQDWQAIGGDNPFQNIYQGSPFAGGQPQAQQAAPQAAPIPQDIFKTATSGGQTTRLARGGIVNDYERAARLHAIYSGGLRKSNYDDGGSVDYFTPSVGAYPYETAEPNLQDFDIQDQLQSDLGESYYGTGILNQDNDPYLNGSGASGTGAGSSISNMLKALGAGGGALASLLGSGSNKAASLPSQYNGQVLNIPTPTNTRAQNNLSGMTMNDWLHAAEGPEINYYQNNALPATQMSAPNDQIAQAISAATGQPFAGGYQYNPIQGGTSQTVGGVAPAPQQPPQQAVPNPGLQSPRMGTQPIPIQAQPRAVMAAGGPYDSPEEAYGTSAVGHVRGPGDGTSDSIRLKNAYLSNGEYVVDAPTLALLGNGSNDAGAKWMDNLRTHVRKSGGKHFVKGKQPMNTAAAASAYAYGGVS